MSTTYTPNDSYKRTTNMIWRVRFSHDNNYVYLLLKFQSSVDPYMAVNLHTDTCVLYMDLLPGFDVLYCR